MYEGCGCCIDVRHDMALPPLARGFPQLFFESSLKFTCVQAYPTTKIFRRQTCGISRLLFLITREHNDDVHDLLICH